MYHFPLFIFKLFLNVGGASNGAGDLVSFSLFFFFVLFCL